PFLDRIGHPCLRCCLCCLFEGSAQKLTLVCSEQVQRDQNHTKCWLFKEVMGGCGQVAGETAPSLLQSCRGWDPSCCMRQKTRDFAGTSRRRLATATQPPCSTSSLGALPNDASEAEAGSLVSLLSIDKCDGKGEEPMNLHRKTELEVLVVRLHWWPAPRAQWDRPNSTLAPSQLCENMADTDDPL
ncbi:hypothetical protein ANANG_G00287020, partial [Anguilla anguilla]